MLAFTLWQGQQPLSHILPGRCLDLACSSIGNQRHAAWPYVSSFLPHTMPLIPACMIPASVFASCGMCCLPPPSHLAFPITIGNRYQVARGGSGRRQLGCCGEGIAAVARVQVEACYSKRLPTHGLGIS